MFKTGSYSDFHDPRDLNGQMNRNIYISEVFRVIVFNAHRRR